LGPVGRDDDSFDASTTWPGGARYERISCIGQGGHGVVYEVFDHLRQRRVALKTLAQSTPLSLLSFKQEFRALAELRHPNLVHLYELVTPADGPEFFTMELVSGVDFRHHTREVRPSASLPVTLPGRPTLRDTAPRGALDAPRGVATPPRARGMTPAKPDELRGALAQLVTGLRALHAAGKLHCDIKPSNVMVSTEGRLVVLDFGLSTDLSHRQALEDGIAGTPEYMAPERLSSQTLQPASDWYAVGTLLFDALVGHPPFRGSPVDVLHQQVSAAPPRPSELVSGVPDDLDELCVRLLSKDPELRPSGREIARLLGDGYGSGRARPSILPMPLAGRTSEVAALERALAEAAMHGPTVVSLHGPSGIGKSSLIACFGELVAREERATVFRSRVYEQESIPYKAIDGLLDALSQHLEAAAREGAAFMPSPSFQAVGHLFPVLRRLPAFAQPDGAELPSDPLRTRELACAGLRQVLSEIARDKPVILAIDDVQWGDLDSAALLLDVLGGDGKLPLLVLLSHRGGGSDAGPFLEKLARERPLAVSLIDLPVGPLSEGDVGQLLVGTLRHRHALSESVVAQVFQMSTGNAFLAQELAYALLLGEAKPSVSMTSAEHDGASLAKALLDERLHGLDDGALRLLEIVAASGRALSTETAALAAGLTSGLEGAVSALSARRLVRADHQRGLEMVQVRHDRIRDWILMRLTPDELRARQRALAEALAGAPSFDPDLWLELWLRSEDSAEIHRVALAAAARAAERLALKRANELYRVALAQLAPDDSRVIAICRKLAQVLEWDGCGAEAAEVYLRAAALSSGFDRSALESIAGLQLIYAGRFAQGAELLRRSLRQLGLPAPASRLSALALLVVGRLRWSRLEKRLARAPKRGTSEAGRARVDILHAAAFGFTFTDPLLGECMQSAHLDAALDEGTAAQAARALALEASQRFHRSNDGREAERLFGRAEEMAMRAGEPTYLDFVRACRGVSHFLCGNWRVAHELLEGAYRDVPRHTTGWHTTAWIYEVLALCNQGRFDRVSTRLGELLGAAVARGDQFTVTSLRVSAKVPLLLARNDPAAARVELRESMSIWDQRSFLVQHWRAMWWSAEIDLYEGKPGAARLRCHTDAARLKKSMLLRVQYIRGMTCFLRGRCALATFDEDPKSRAAEVRHLQKELTAVGRGWTHALAAMLSAGLALRMNDLTQGLPQLEAAAQLTARVDMPAHSAACRLLLAEQLGGDEGQAESRAAYAELQRAGVVDVEKLAAALLPARRR
jgi:eukaryotic-like serine/threonine-protein kinase